MGWNTQEQREIQDTLSTEGPRSWAEVKDVGGLEASQTRLEKAVTTVMATTMAVRNEQFEGPR